MKGKCCTVTESTAKAEIFYLTPYLYNLLVGELFIRIVQIAAFQRNQEDLIGLL